MRLPNKRWQTILEKLIIKDIPFKFLKKIQVILLDGNVISVSSQQELIKLINQLKEAGGPDPIQEISYLFDYKKLSKTVETQVELTYSEVFKKKQEKNDKPKRRKK